MNPVLIFTDTYRIDAEKEYLDEVAEYCNKLYNSFKTIGITVTLQDIANVTSIFNRQNCNPNYLPNFVSEKLLDIAGGHTVNGITLQRDKVKDFMSIPNLSIIEQVVRGYNSLSEVEDDRSHTKGIDLKFLTFDGDVIIKKTNADAQIEALHTHYTKTDKSAQMVTDIQPVATAINTYISAHPSKFQHEAAFVKNYQNMPGLDYRNGAFVVSLSFIRNYEAMSAM